MLPDLYCRLLNSDFRRITAPSEQTRGRMYDITGMTVSEQKYTGLPQLILRVLSDLVLVFVWKSSFRIDARVIVETDFRRLLTGSLLGWSETFRSSNRSLISSRTCWNVSEPLGNSSLQIKCPLKYGKWYPFKSPLNFTFGHSEPFLTSAGTGPSSLDPKPPRTDKLSFSGMVTGLVVATKRALVLLTRKLYIFFISIRITFDVHNPTKPVLAFSIEHIIKRSFSKVNDQMTPNSKGVLLHPHDCMQTTQNVDGSQWSGKMNVSIVFLVAIYTLTRLSQFQDRKLPAFTTTSPKTRSTANAPNWHTSNDNQLVLATSWSDLKYSLLKVYQPSEISPVYANNCSSNV